MSYEYFSTSTAESQSKTKKFFAKCIYTNNTRNKNYACLDFDIEISGTKIKTMIPGDPTSPLNDEFDQSLSVSKNGSVMVVVDKNSDEFKYVLKQLGMSSTNKMCIKILNPNMMMNSVITSSYYLLYPASEVNLKCLSTNHGKCIDIVLKNGRFIRPKNMSSGQVKTDELLEPTSNVHYLSTKHGSLIFPDENESQLTVVNPKKLITVNGKQVPMVAKYQVPTVSNSTMPSAIRKRRMTVTPGGLYRHDKQNMFSGFNIFKNLFK